MPGLLRDLWSGKGAVALLLVLWPLAGVPFFVKHAGIPTLALLYAIALAALLVLLPRVAASRGLSADSQLYVAFALSIFALACIALHPLTRDVTHPSTAPEALLESVRRTLDGRYPYDARLSDGAPISPGLAWALLFSPLALTGTIAAATALALAGLFWSLRKAEAASAVIGLLLLLACIPLQQAAVVGHDLYVAGICLTALIVGAGAFRCSIAAMLFFAILLAIVSSSRVPMIVVPMAVGTFLWREDRKLALVGALAGTAIALVLHLALASIGVHLDFEYQPLHILARGVSAGTSTLVFFTVGWLLYIAVVAFMTPPGLVARLVGAFLALAPPFIFVGLSELVSAGISSSHAWALWEGKNYVAFLTPLLATAVALSAGRAGRKIG